MTGLSLQDPPVTAVTAFSFQAIISTNNANGLSHPHTTSTSTVASSSSSTTSSSPHHHRHLHLLLVHHHHHATSSTSLPPPPPPPPHTRRTAMHAYAPGSRMRRRLRPDRPTLRSRSGNRRGGRSIVRIPWYFLSIFQSFNLSLSRSLPPSLSASLSASLSPAMSPSLSQYLSLHLRIPPPHTWLPALPRVLRAAVPLRTIFIIILLPPLA